MKKILFLSALVLACALSFTPGVSEAADITLGTGISGTLYDAVADAMQDYVTDNGSGDLSFTVTVPSQTGSIGTTITVPSTHTVTLDGESLTATLTTVTLQGGTWTAPSGSRHFEVADNGTAAFAGVTFQGNSGGGIDISGGTVSFTGATTFTGNSSSTGGGALDISGGTVSFNDTAMTTFSSNFSTAAGGALNLSGSVSTAFAGSVMFTGNYSSSNGGAVSLSGTSSVTFTSDAAFTDNYSSGASGGALYLADTSRATFSSTAAFRSNRADAGSGGALNIAGATASFSGSATFTSNTASSSGGAINMESGTLTFTGAPTFTSNTASSNGGAINAESGTLTFTGAPTFTSNTASSNGGAINVESGTLTFTEAPTFTTNGVSTGNGGAVNTAVAVSFPGATFSGNYATSGTGGALNITGGTVTFTGAATFGVASTSGNANQATSGGAIYVADNSTVSFTSTAAFSSNKATAGSGGAIYLAADTSSMSFTSQPAFTGNTATNGSGGAIYATVASQVTGGLSAGAAFTSNQTVTSGNGGALYIADSTGTALTLDSSFTFTQNTAAGNGGAVYSAAAMRLTGATFGGESTGNTAVNGGAVYANNGLTVSGGTFEYNTATGSGGAVYINGGTATITGGTFTYNESQGTGTDTDYGGGAIYDNVTAGSSVSLSISGSVTFSNNSAVSYGGAIYCRPVLNITGATFSANSTSDGAGGAIHAKNNITTEDVEFSGNIAGGTSGNGGAIYTDGLGTLTRTSFSENNAGLSGGAIIAAGSSSGEFKVSRCYFYANRSATNGGAICTANSQINFNLEKSFFDTNVSGSNNADDGGKGGAIAFSVVGTVTVGTSTFSGNIALHASDSKGGAIYMPAHSSAATFTNCVFTDNIARGATTANGGGALALNGPVTLLNCTFSTGTTSGQGNQAGDTSTTGHGGAVFVESGTITVAGCLIVGNSASSGIGNDVYIGSGSIRSQGYNRVGVIGQGSGNSLWSVLAPGGSTTDRESSSWTAGDFFNGEELTDNGSGSDSSYIYVGASGSVTRPTLALNQSESLTASDTGNRALDVIPTTGTSISFPTVDTRGVSRPQPSSGLKDIGAFEVENSGGTTSEDIDNPNIDRALKSLTISDIPNTLTTIGQTTVLIAYAHYTDGTTSTSEPVTWTSDNEGVAVIGRDSGVIYTCGLGSVTITATTRRSTGNLSATKTLLVSNQAKYLSIHPDVYNRLVSFNDRLRQDNYYATLAFADVAITSDFKTEFQNTWAASVTQLSAGTAASNYSFAVSPVSSFSGDGSEALDAGVKISVANQNTGTVVPLKYTWTLSSDDLALFLNVNSETLKGLGDAAIRTRIAGALRVDLQTSGTDCLNVIGDSVTASDAQGAKFTVASAASQSDTGSTAADTSSSVLTITPTNNYGANIELVAVLANVASSSGGPRLVKSSGSEKMLVVPDGIADTTLEGTMWLTQKTSPSSGGDGDGGTKNSSGGGGGGCGVLSSGLAAVLVPVLALRAKKQKEKAGKSAK